MKFETSRALSEIPKLGSGIGYRADIRRQLIENRDALDFVEIIADQFTAPQKTQALEEVCEYFTVIPHGIGLSIGSMGRPDSEYLRGIRRVSDLTKSSYYSEHLCMTRVPGIEIGHLSPLWLTHEVLQNAIINVNEIQDVLGKPLVLENVTYLFEIPNAMEFSDFVSKLVAETGCGLLLDVTNVYVNSKNHGFDPSWFLRQMPLNNIVQVHLAGGFWSDGVLIDSHSALVHQESWALLEELCCLAPVKASIIEHDSDFPDDLTELLSQVARARAVIRG